jgi:hypothetical protein
MTRLEWICVVSLGLLAGLLAWSLATRERNPAPAGIADARGTREAEDAVGLTADIVDEDPDPGALDASASEDPAFTHAALGIAIPGSSPSGSDIDHRSGTPSESDTTRGHGAQSADTGRGEFRAARRPVPPRLLGTNEIEAALARVESMPWGPEAAGLLEDTLSNWARQDPGSAISFAMGIESLRTRASMVSSLAGDWARRDFEAAYRWVVGNLGGEPALLASALRPLFNALAEANPEAALQRALQLPDGAARVSAMRAAVEQAARQGKTSALLPHLSSLPTAYEQQQFASALAQSWSLDDPAAALQWALTLSSPGVRSAAMSGAVRTWAADRPDLAAAWVQSLPSGRERDAQMNHLVSSWARVDPVDAADWILAQSPPSRSLDGAIQGLVVAVAGSNPEGATRWAAVVTDPKLRNKLTEQAARIWLRQDPARAAAYINTLPPAARQRLLR